MKSRVKIALLGAAILAMLPVITQAKDQMWQLGLLAVPGGSMVYGGLEKKRGNSSSTTYRIGSISYEYTDGDYQEWGEGMVVGVGSKFFSSADQTGGYFGINLDYVTVDGGWYEWGGGGWFSGSGILPGVTAGTRIANGDIHIEPNVSAAAMSAGNASAMLVALGVVISF